MVPVTIVPYGAPPQLDAIRARGAVGVNRPPLVMDLAALDDRGNAFQHTVFAADITAAVGHINGGSISKRGAVVGIMNVDCAVLDPAIVDPRCRRFEAISFPSALQEPVIVPWLCVRWWRPLTNRGSSARLSVELLPRQRRFQSTRSQSLLLSPTMAALVAVSVATVFAHFRGERRSAPDRV